MTPEELFRKWATLEPERCREVEENFDLRIDYSTAAGWISIHSSRFSESPSFSGWATVQAVVQRALHDRRLAFHLVDISNYQAGIDAYEVDIWTEDDCLIAGASAPAPAPCLLDAYLSAIELLADQVAQEAGGADRPLKVPVTPAEYQAIAQLDQPCTPEEVAGILDDARAAAIFSASFHEQDVEVYVKGAGDE